MPTAELLFTKAFQRLLVFRKSSAVFIIVAVLQTGLLAHASSFASYFQASPAPMLMICPDEGMILDANPAAEAFYGWSKQALQAMRITQINTLSAEEVARRMQMASKLEQNYFVFEHRMANKEHKRVEVYSVLMVFEDKKVLVSTVVDASPQKNIAYDREYFETLAKEALKTEETTPPSLQKAFASWSLWVVGLMGLLLLISFLVRANMGHKRKNIHLQREIERLSLLFEQTEAAYIVATDSKGVISFFNKGAQKLLGYKLDEVLGRETPVTFHDPEEVAQLRETIEKEMSAPVTPFYALTCAARREGHETSRVTLKGKNPDPVELLLSLSCLKNAKGEVVGYLGIGVDASKQFEAVKSCEEKVKTHTQALATLGLGLWTWNVPTGEIQADDQCYRLLGHPPQAFVLTFEVWMNLIHPDNQSKTQETIEEQLAQGDETLVYCSYSNANGQWVRVETCGKVIERDENGGARRVVGTMRCLSDGHWAQIRPLF